MTENSVSLTTTNQFSFMSDSAERKMSCTDTTSHDEDRYYDVALNLVKEAGSVIREAYEKPRGGDVNIKTKASDVDLVTESDKKVEELLFRGLEKEFPGHKFIGEESVSDGAKVEFTDAPTWIIDPIDGTTNFVHRMPFVCVSVGLTIKKKVVIGIIYNPIMDEIFTARLGKGAYKNGFPIRTSGTKEETKALVMSSMGIHNIAHIGKGVTKTYMENTEMLVGLGIRGHRSLGSAALNMCFVAQGSADCYVEYGVHCWDMAAGYLIVREAGGTVIDPPGGPFNLMKRSVLCASSEELAKIFSQKLIHVDYELEFA